MQITLVGAAKTKPSSRNSVGDVSILLDTFAGNTTWLLGSQAIESIDINEIIPTAIQEVHKTWVKTIFNASKNIRSSWSNLTSMLSRPTKIFNPSTNEENLVSIEMGNAEAATSDEKITLSVTITKLTPASNISAEKQSEINALELASKRKRAVFFESLLKSPLTEPSMLEQSDISLERSQTASL